MNQDRMNERQVVADEYSQEEFSDDSINVSCVLTWKVLPSAGLIVDFHHQVVFDSTRSNVKAARIEAAIKKLRNGT